MQSSDFNKYFEAVPIIKKHFIGVFSIDTLPKKIQLKSFCICNTDIQSGNGKHWICFVRSSKTSIELFDSLGVDAEKKSLVTKFAKFNVNEIIFNETQFQSSLSTTCGMFVLYFVFERFFNLDIAFDDLLFDIFDENLDKNEETVKKFCEQTILDD